MATTLLFEQLSAGEQQRAKTRFIGAASGDGYSYELDMEGHVLCRAPLHIMKSTYYRGCERCGYIGSFIDDGETCPHCKLVQ